MTSDVSLYRCIAYVGADVMYTGDEGTLSLDHIWLRVPDNRPWVVLYDPVQGTYIVSDLSYVLRGVDHTDVHVYLGGSTTEHDDLDAAMMVARFKAAEGLASLLRN